MRHLIVTCTLTTLLLVTEAFGAPRPQQTASAIPGATVATVAAGAVCAIEGAVVNAQTGEPVRKAQVTAVREGGENAGNQGPQAVVSDSSGHFSVTGLEPGRYRLEVEADRFAGQAYGAKRPGGPGKPIELGNGQTIRDLSVRLQPAGVITGTVHDEDGDPMMHAFVRAVPVGRVRVFQGTQAETNDLGAYRIYGLAAGAYIIEVNPQQRGDQSQPSSSAYVPTYYPGVTNRSSAAQIAVQPGSEVQQIDVDLKPVRAATVRGKIVNSATGGSAQGGWVGLEPRDSETDPLGGVVGMSLPGVRYSAGVQDPQGSFEIHNVPSGSYWLTATMQDGRRQYQGRTLVEVADSDVQGVVVQVGPGVTLAGRVRVEPPKPFNYASLAVNLLPQEMTMGGGGAQAKADGSFVIPDVNSGSYRINVSGFPEEYYVKYAKLGGADVLESGLNVDSPSPGSLEITLSSQGGTVTGAVFHDHQPAAATVFLVPDPPRRNRLDLYSTKATKADGTFSLLGLPPGDFKLFAFEDADPGLFADLSLLQPFEAKGQSVHIDDGSSQSVRLELIPADADR